jgi:hypothetical protein
VRGRESRHILKAESGLEFIVLQCAGRAERNARRISALEKTMVAERAFRDRPRAAKGVRRVIRTGPGAVVAADAKASIDKHSAGGGISCIRSGRAAQQAGRFRTMLASERQVEPGCIRVPVEVEGVDFSPALLWPQVILDAAGKTAGLTAGASIQVQNETSHHGTLAISTRLS